MSHPLTTANKILVAAARLDEEKETFTAEDLIVRAWSEYPESFGLTGYANQYPDSNRVLAKLMGSVGLCHRGWLEQVSTKTYKMTPSGRKFAQALRTGASAPEADAAKKPAAAAPVAAARTTRKVSERDARPAAASRAERIAVIARSAAKQAALVATPASRPASEARKAAVAPEPRKAAVAPAPPSEPVAPEPPSAPVDLSKPFEGMGTLQRMVTSVANQKWARGAMVTFADACAFWGITPSVHAAHLKPRLAEVEDVLARAMARIQAARQSIRVDDRIEVTLTTVVGLQGLHRTMLQKYNREIEAIRARLADD